jgi:von Willebrand factor type A C-terminal domain/von Willebrand factor type A domain
LAFKAEVYQNQYLAQGAKEVHAIMTVSADSATTVATGGRLFGIICDTSGSMEGGKIRAAKAAIARLIALIPEDAAFFVVTGSQEAVLRFPASPATPANRARAIESIQNIDANGGTTISTWLIRARAEFVKMPNATRQAVLLTDGENEPNDEPLLNSALAACEGIFQCDCRGVGTDWKIAELKKIADKLLGTTDIIASPQQIEADFSAILQKAMSKAVSDVALRLWTPSGARVLFCKEVSPEIVDLTSRAKLVKPQVQDFATGSWAGNESRDYHFCIEVKPGAVGDEMLAGRASLIASVWGVETKLSEARILAIWTDDEAQSTKIERHVAHYTGQAELAQSIQEGLEARAKGDTDVATAKLGKAVKIAYESGNDATAKLLRTIVDVENAAEGTVRLKRGVAKEDEMALETRSTKTSRIVR